MMMIIIIMKMQAKMPQTQLKTFMEHKRAKQPTGKLYYISPRKAEKRSKLFLQNRNLVVVH